MTDQPDDAGHDNDNTSLISLQQQQQVQYWTTRLGVSRNQLLQAIDAVGDSAPQVEAWLKYQGQLTN
ncbi:DUF3606 domain-containing protein [Pseudoxanthomonas sacheonensis]|jgi:hypothetical protein|uniref:DUF3606 domain-containing protein n=1 Tax=Pseudoxanthomonas sacheonensis TaxID=443615 RepID=A0ABU1RRT4_9GAMM|nr:DUF3606 domain-containing protein [Pseudoxanthomonas sacheonensis]MDR6841479.1 hypothetical protein [Pseudoxanthomonas sacheonensis]